jgi:hypothetical protein
MLKNQDDASHRGGCHSGGTVTLGPEVDYRATKSECQWRSNLYSHPRGHTAYRTRQTAQTDLQPPVRTWGAWKRRMISQ